MEFCTKREYNCLVVKEKRTNNKYLFEWEDSEQ